MSVFGWHWSRPIPPGLGSATANRRWYGGGRPLAGAVPLIFGINRAKTGAGSECAIRKGEPNYSSGLPLAPPSALVTPTKGGWGGDFSLLQLPPPTYSKPHLQSR